MIAVILSGHGGFASGLAQAVHQVIGEQDQFKFIDFPEEMTTPQLEVAMRSAIADIDSGEGIVFLTGPARWHTISHRLTTKPRA